MAKRRKRVKVKRPKHVKKFSIKKKRGKNVFDVNIPKGYTRAQSKKALTMFLQKYRPDVSDESVKVNVFSVYHNDLSVRTFLYEMDDSGDYGEFGDMFDDAIDTVHDHGYRSKT